ncbi:FliH/SctL family protein [Lachnospiraceae bacterium 54-53]
MSKIIRGDQQTEAILRYNFDRTFEDIIEKEEKKKKEHGWDPILENIQQTADIFEAASKKAAEIENRAGEEAGEILTSAEEEAKRLISEAKEEAEKIRKEAREDGYKDGYDTGFEEGYRKVHEEHKADMDRIAEEFHADMKAAIEEVTKEKDRALDKYMDDLKKITLTIAEKVIQTSLKSSGEIVKRMIVAAAGKLKKTQWVKIYVSQNDAGMMIHGDVGLLNELSHISGNIKIIAMDHAEDGTCIIELPEEIIDVSVNTQMENIKGILNNARL